VLSENVLYGPAQVSTVSDTHRLVLNQLSGSGEVWEVAQDGSERVRLQGPPQSQTAQKMLPVMESMRDGSLAPVEVHDTRIPDPETFQMLATLGYIEEEPPKEPAPEE
jgi:hypothetical protein